MNVQEQERWFPLKILNNDQQHRATIDSNGWKEYIYTISRIIIIYVKYYLYTVTRALYDSMILCFQTNSSNQFLLT